MMAANKWGFRSPPTRLLLQLALLVNLGVATSYVWLLASMARQRVFWQADFTAFYTGWSIVRDGLGARLYDVGLQTAYQQEILGGRSFADGLLPYVNPPHAALPFVPLSFLSLSDAFYVWTGFQLALLCWLVYRSLTMTGRWSLLERSSMVAAIVAAPPVLFSLQLGTKSLLMAVALLEFCDAVKKGQNWKAAVSLTLGSIKPQLFLLPAVAFLLVSGRRAFALALFVGGTSLVAASEVLGWNIWRAYLTLIQSVGQGAFPFGVDPTAMYNLKGTLALSSNLDAAQLDSISWMALGVAAAMMPWIWWRPERFDRASVELRLSLSISAGLLLSPHMNRHDALLFVVPAFLVYSYLRTRQMPIGAFSAFALSFPVVTLISEFTVGTGFGIRVPVALLILLCLYTFRLVIRENAAQSTPVTAT